ncbi:hypothetical protein K3181_11125 [Qipengyuania sp. YG27]|uniref:Sugar transporter n=1 Tax=Qipengyuania mesophila TaxID=2867246 RepID=A0ABS7JWG7_9SPHN|nr:hypothetical protein [Qipengyuania mesophila]MBX7501994.1 hypothetical protein [Qipengyuania mesophila]
MDNPGKAPWHLWVVGLVSLLWNAFGGYDYTMSQLRDPAYLEATMGPMGMSVDQSIAFLDSFPVWADVLWALGVWGSVAGSVLLLLRSRFAVTAFLVSLVGAILSFAYQYTIDLPPQLADNTMGKIMPLVIILAVVLQWWYARSQKAAGVLR